MQKPSIPKGTRDFGPVEMVRRNYIFDNIKKIFRRYGYMPLETPSMENLSTLMGKYGEEGDKLLFKILNSGDFLSKVAEGATPTTTQICEKGLRYDLTVPFARYVVQHQAEIQLPFKRYQIQPVWRADRPQKGRYREFYQCDVDVIGSRSLLNEAELVQIVEDVFEVLNIGVTLKINNRKILFGIAETMGCADKMMDITVAIDKIDKIGLEAVTAELKSKGIDDKGIEILTPILTLSGDNKAKLATMKQSLSSSETGMLGIAEIEELLSYTEAVGTKLDIELDLSLARGLNYYTGAIFEVKAKDYAIGSICGGGRYDDLTGIFGMKNTSGVGISFGADRIYDVMCGLELFPQGADIKVKALFLNFGSEAQTAAIVAAKKLRSKDIATEVYPDNAKIKKQMDYANRANIPYVIIIGSEELASGMATVKDMNSGTQQSIAIDELYTVFN